MKSLFRDKVDENKYYIATYHLKSSPSSTLREAAFNLAVGQSIGNPAKRAEMETEEMFENHACIVLADESELEKKVEGDVSMHSLKQILILPQTVFLNYLCKQWGGRWILT